MHPSLVEKKCLTHRTDDTLRLFISLDGFCKYLMKVKWQQATLKRRYVQPIVCLPPYMRVHEPLLLWISRVRVIYFQLYI